MEHRGPDIVVVDKDDNRAFLIDIAEFAVPRNTAVNEKDQEKVHKRL